MTRKSLLLAALSVTLAVETAGAGGFDVKGAEVAKGETELSVSSAVQSGFPRNADLVRAATDLGLSYGFTDWWKAGLKLSLEQAVGGDWRVVSIGGEFQALLRKGEGRSPSIAWFVGVDNGIGAGNPNVLALGPLWQWSLDDKTSFTANTLLQRQFGADSTPGTDFAYAWQWKRDVRDGVGIGVEGYGLLPNIGHTPGIDLQEHRIGPVIYLERSLARAPSAPHKLSLKDTAAAAPTAAASDPKVSLEIGVLFGLTAATPDHTLKVKGGITF